jgi:DNA-binding transcriptional ArsR family regulator
VLVAKRAKTRFEAKVYSNMPPAQRMAKVLADPLRIKIVSELGMREMSPKQFYDEFGGGTFSRVSRAFDVLVEYGWLRETRTETGGKRRGAVEHFYRATQPALFDEITWPALPDPVKEVFTGAAFETYAVRVREALEAGTIDARDDRHFSWMPLRLDQQGWKSVIARVDAIFHFLLEEQTKADARMEETGEEPIPMTVALAAFESPKDTEKQP